MEVEQQCLPYVWLRSAYSRKTGFIHHLHDVIHTVLLVAACLLPIALLQYLGEEIKAFSLILSGLFSLVCLYHPTWRWIWGSVLPKWERPLPAWALGWKFQDIKKWRQKCPIRYGAQTFMNCSPRAQLWAVCLRTRLSSMMQRGLGPGHWCYFSGECYRRAL